MALYDQIGTIATVGIMGSVAKSAMGGTRRRSRKRKTRRRRR